MVSNIPRVNRIAALLLAAFVLLLGGCVSGVPVAITNNSSSKLTHVSVTGKGFSVSVRSIAAGATETIRIRPREATTVRVAFEADGQRFSATTENEIENDDINTVVATFGEDHNLTIATPLR